jgi:hypothetical protein
MQVQVIVAALTSSSEAMFCGRGRKGRNAALRRCHAHIICKGIERFDCGDKMIALGVFAVAVRAQLRGVSIIMSATSA